MAQSNQSAQAVESVEKTEVAKKAAKTASTRAAKTATTSTATKTTATKRTTSRTARTTATKATTAVRSARTSKAAATKSATAKRPASSAVFNARLAAHQDELEQLFMSLYNDHDAFDALVASMAAAYARRFEASRQNPRAGPGLVQARRYVRHDHVHRPVRRRPQETCRQDSVLEGAEAHLPALDAAA